MLDFIKAALPWIAIGLSMIIAGMSSKSRKAKASSETTDVKKDGKENYIAVGMCVGMSIGMSIGMLLGQLLYNNLALGMCIGMSIGLAAGSSIKKKKETPTV